MAEKWNVKFWANWAKAIKRLPDGERGAFLEKWLDAVFFGESPEWNMVEGMLWDMMENTIDSDRGKSIAGHETGRRKGSGNPRKGSAEGLQKGSRKGSRKGSAEGCAQTVAQTVPFHESEAEAEYESEAQDEGEGNARGSAEGFPLFLHECIEIYNDESDTGILDVEVTGIEREQVRQAFENGRTLEQVRAAIRAARDRWGPERATFKAVFKGSNLAQLSAAGPEADRGWMP